MRINQNAILPAQVRYDKAITDKAKLLYAEISAAVNAYGICEEDNNYLASAIGVDLRTVTRAISALIDNGHLQKIRENGKKKLKLINRGLELPPGVEITEEFPEPLSPETENFTRELIKVWEDHLGIHIEKWELYMPLIAARLNEFSKEEILSAARNRIKFLLMSEWHRREENWQSATSLDGFINASENVRKWLNAKPKEDEKVELKPFER